MADRCSLTLRVVDAKMKSMEWNGSFVVHLGRIEKRQLKFSDFRCKYLSKIVATRCSTLLGLFGESFVVGWDMEDNERRKDKEKEKKRKENRIK